MGRPAAKLNISYRKKLNTSLFCKVRGCPRNRYQFMSVCQRHSEAKYKYGVPGARSLRRGEYGNEWAAANRFARIFKKHESIVQGEALLEKWLLDAQAGKDVPGKKSMGYLADMGAVPRELLIEILAVGAYRATHS